ncbi:MBL fold metallo-hydrolase [Pseudomonas sp. RGM2987]|uniref:MBL fold metallo-hydrolase n=1 Tax=Pseudomonas sp. RGM2987 TaxID=2930090 RepID=UPI001FD6C72D|nr:MBL fold metallo-hydrolase [Pseudomonas sp. RGM2987]MCJ8206424.1 MBL fold metallo-hydrolase [Pseudomonas sp. RGM2987]
MSTVDLEYPFQKPERGSVTEVIPGVLWIRMPLPFRLDHVNLWLIRDDNGWVVVDTGMFNDVAEATWEMILHDVLKGEQITTVIVTHMHADHIGMAGWLVKRFNCQLRMTGGEYRGCQDLLMLEETMLAEKVGFYHRAGWNQEALSNLQNNYGAFKSMVHPLPSTFRQLADGEQILIGGNDWQVIVGQGHTVEHACLYCQQLKLFISGDQVLPRITSNVSVPSHNPESNPMGGWMMTLYKIKRMVFDNVLVLPAHNECFNGLHARLENLLNIQYHLFSDLLLFLRLPRRSIDVFQCLFGREITMSDGILLTMATGESLANLNYLIVSGRVMKSQDSFGVDWYQATRL